MKLVVGHLYPELSEHLCRSREHRGARAAGRAGVASISRCGRSALGDPTPADVDLFYVGGGQDREQALIADDLAAEGPAIAEAVEGGAAVLAVCGGYQLLGRLYRDRSACELPGAGVFPLETVGGERRMIGDVLLECELERRAADGGGLREPRRPDGPRRRARAARPRRLRVRERR